MKQRKWLLLLACAGVLAVILAGVWLLSQSASQAASLRAARSQEQDEARREADGDGLVPAISYIDSPSPTCALPEPGTDVCYIQWQYLNVTASPGQYIISSTITLDGHLQAFVSGFFQSSMFLPGTMLTPGFRVPCGAPGASGNPARGFDYAFILRARETGGLSAANFGTVSCPFDIISLVELRVDGPSIGVLGHPVLFDASVFPITATLPITYSWSPADLPPVVIVDGTSTLASFTWSTPGDKRISVTAKNGNSILSVGMLISIRASYEVYLPLMER
ncbi:MAG: hypothetical protein HUU38_31120 [Anaerolineales bacterium]|jgi:hypothetical protein|nr:hypothetical protein [Anaerolineales bacterium]